MKTAYILFYILLSPAILYGQKVTPQNPGKVAPTDTIVPGNGTPEQQLEKIKAVKVKKLSDMHGNEPKKSKLVDTTLHNKYGDLLIDDTLHNRKYPLWIPFVEGIGTNLITWSLDRYIINADYSRVGPVVWRDNIKKGWEWDIDRFGVNFIGHPYAGTLYFNAGRANGYNYYQSGLFAVAGSFMWEYLGENTRPSYNDIIYTPVNGSFLGEILYRLSSNVLDDRTRGMQRFSRELLAGVINPMRGLNRIIQGKTRRSTNKEVYEKEPLNVALYTGIHKINDGIKPNFAKGTNSIMLNVQFDYGNPFEKRARKAFDFFKFRTEFDLGVLRFVSNITGYGILAGKNVNYGKHSMLFGIFEYSDYWDNKTFELGAIAIGGGIFSKIPINKTSELYTNIHIGAIPFAGNSSRFGPDTSLIKDYDFGNGLEGKIESTINIGKFATASLIYYYFVIHTIVGPPGNNLIAILKPRATVRLYKGLSIGFEHFVYYNNRYLRNSIAIHAIRTEQKLFLLYYFEDKQRRGHYN